MVFQRAKARLSGFRRQRRHKKWRRRRRTSPVGTVSQPIGKPFNGQAKGLLWLTWRSYAGPPQYFIPPEGGALNPSGRRQPVPDRTLGAQGQRPGGWLNPHARKGVSTFGNTASRRFLPKAHGFRRHRRVQYLQRPYVSSSWLMTRFFVFMKFGATRTTSTRAMRA